MRGEPVFCRKKDKDGYLYICTLEDEDLYQSKIDGMPYRIINEKMKYCGIKSKRLLAQVRGKRIPWIRTVYAALKGEPNYFVHIINKNKPPLIDNLTTSINETNYFKRANQERLERLGPTLSREAMWMNRFKHKSKLEHEA